MKYKTLFRLGLKLIGAFLALRSVAELLEYAGSVAFELAGFGTPSGRQAVFSEWALRGIFGQLLQVAMGAYLFFRGRWIADLAIPSNRPYCPECAYDLTGATSERCPECGTPFHREDVRAPTNA